MPQHTGHCFHIHAVEQGRCGERGLDGIDGTDGEQLLPWEKLRLITNKLADTRERIARPTWLIIETCRLLTVKALCN